MNRILREVVLGAVSCAAVVGPAAAQSASAPSGPAAGPTMAATPPAVPRAIPVGRILVEGNQRIEPSTVLSYLVVRPGDLPTPERIDTSIKTLFATGYFADVRIEQQGGDLIVRVVENPIVNQVVFEGAKNLKEEDLEKEVQAKPRSVFTTARAQADAQRIVELYRRAGRFAAVVTPQVRQLEQNRVDLVYEIDEGPVTGVRSINFIGNRAFSDGDLRDAIVTEASQWWKFFSRNDNYDPDRLEYDREQLRQFYTNRGYADFRIVSAVAELTPDRRDFYITFTIDEGVKYDFGQIKVETELDKLDEGFLRAIVPIREGDQYEGKLIEDAVDSITFAAGSAGYANVDIRPRVDRDRENRKVNITFNVNEGPRVFIERIDIVGNSRTIDPVIRRELRLAEGDAFNRILLDRSKSRVRALGFFKEVEIEEREGSLPDRTVVEVTVEEQPTGELAFAAGFSSQESFLFDVSVSERNLRGRGQFLRLRASTSQRTQQLDLRFTEPRFLGRNLAAGFDLFTVRTDFLDESSFENQSTGAGVRAAFPLSERAGLSTSLTVRQDDTEVADLQVTAPNGGVVDQCSPTLATRPSICDSEGSFLTSVGSYRLSYDRRNDPIRPTRGFDLSLSQDFAGIGGDVKYLRSEAEATAYRGLFGGVVASFSLGGGYVMGWDDQDVRINDRFFKGGSSFRGFDVAGIGPRQIFKQTITDASGAVISDQETVGDALGGKAFYIGTLQVEFPLGLPKEFGVSAAAFYEFGGLGELDDRSAASQSVSFPTAGPDGLLGLGPDNLLGTADDILADQVDNGLNTTSFLVEDELSFRSAYGISIFWDSPFGPVQFDFADPVDRETYDQTETFRFSTRTRF